MHTPAVHYDLAFHSQDFPQWRAGWIIHGLKPLTPGKVDYGQGVADHRNRFGEVLAS
ncbi:MAG: hypothetical protein ACO34E_15040 [Limisphaerales bacterium]